MQNGHFCQHGDDAYSYATCLQTTAMTGHTIQNVTQYSKTTSKHQSQLWGAEEVKSFRKGPAVHRNPSYIVLNDVPRGATADDLRAIAEGAK